jgi:hypothetical protein
MGNSMLCEPVVRTGEAPPVGLFWLDLGMWGTDLFRGGNSNI